MKTNTIFWYVCILLINFGCTSLETSPQGDRSWSQSKLIDMSDYIFQGKISGEKSEQIPIKLDDMQVQNVQVEKVISSGAGYENFEGGTVQVVFDSSAKYETGKSYMFYTKTWLFGKTLTVIANQVAATFDTKKVQEEIEAYHTLQEDKKIRERLNRAELVVIGEVRTIIDNKESSRSRESEHNPEWQIASLQINEVLKGTQTVDNINVFYAKSRDVHWYRSPKLTVSQKGIFILNRKEQYKETEGNFVITENIEYFPNSQENKIKELLKTKN